mgnify:CR=1 FL=1
MIYILDYDAGNLLSIKRSLEFLKFKYSIIKKAKIFSSEDILLIPGVGSFASASKRILKSGILEITYQKPSDRPFILGICLGMQLLMSYSLEGKRSAGLNLIKGSVDSIFYNKPKDLEIPKTLIGWEEFKIQKIINEELYFLKKYQNQSFYHVHSYMCKPEERKNIIATYCDELSFIPNIIGDVNKKVLGLQFHPEKSGGVGLQLLKDIINFIEKNK